MSFRLSMSAVISLVAIFSLWSTSCNKRSDSQIQSISSQESQTEGRRLYFIYGPLIRSISVNDLENFATKGIAAGDIGNIIQFGKLDAQQLRGQLSKEYALDFVDTTNILNNPVGVAILSKLGDAVHPHKTKTAAVQAVRAAIVQSLQDDNKLSPLEVLKNLPVDMDVEVEEVLKLRDELARVFLKG